VLFMHLARMLSYEAGTRTGVDIEDLHKMRVATRRMRAAWRVFDGAYRPRAQRRHVRELRVVAAALGEVRDMDVQLEGLDTYLGTLPDAGAAALEPLRGAWRRLREEARQRLLELLDSRAYREFVDDYLDFVETPGADEQPPLPGQPILVRDIAAGRIWQAYERVRAHDTTLAWADVPALHALRIESKRLRYTLEAFREVLPPRVDQLIARVTELQDHLGLLNDADVASQMTRAWLTGNASQVGGATRQAASLFLESREAEVQRLRRTFGRPWRNVNGTTFRHGLALTLSAL
jgi:CHAD domain-containing protein